LKSKINRNYQNKNEDLDEEIEDLNMFINNEGQVGKSFAIH